MALEGVDIALKPGEILALMGENGAGKSTLMKILSGVYEHHQGTIEVDGRPVRFSNVREAEAAGIAIIHQELNLVPELSVADNIFLGRELRVAGLIVNRKATVKAASELLKRVGIQLAPNARISSLRVGEQQLVEIAKALSISARILIMDEPTSALSAAECERLFGIIRGLAASGVAIVYISHRLDEVMHLADTVTVLRDGRHVLSQPMATLNQDTIIAAMVGRELLSADRDPGTPSTDILLAVRNLRLSVPHGQGWQAVLKGVSFELHAGEILGIGGLLGSGRTEILETIFGAWQGRVLGEILLDGRPIGALSPKHSSRRGIALVTEDRKTQGLQLTASVIDNIALPLAGRMARFLACGCSAAKPGGPVRPSSRSACAAQDGSSRMNVWQPLSRTKPYWGLVAGQFVGPQHFSVLRQPA